jgi:Peptidase family M23
MQWRRWMTGVMLMSAPLLQAAPTAHAMDSVPLPFDQGETISILQGYNGATHHDASVYGLDLVLTSGETSGATVISPLEGTVAWAYEPGDKTGCMEVVAKDRSYGVMVCHVLLDRPFSRGEKIIRGQQLGAVGAPGMLGNNGLAHVHMELHKDGRGSEPVPFGGADGVPLEYNDLPASGAPNEYASLVLTSSNVFAGAAQPGI